MSLLAGKSAVVIGANGRLGPVWVSALVQAGATVIGLSLPAWDLRRDRLDTAPDVLVLNAGVDDRPGSPEPWPKLDTARQMCEVNLWGAHRLLADVGPRMRCGSAIVCISSLYGIVSPDAHYYDHRADGWMKSAMYGATKAGVISMVRYFAALLGPRGIRVNAIAPGGVVDPSDALTAGDAEFQEKYTVRIPLGRMCQPADLVGPLLFLASEASSFVTGHCLVLDGGFTCW